VKLRPINSNNDFGYFMDVPLDVCSDEIVPKRQLPELFKKPVVTLQSCFDKESKGNKVMRSREREILYQMKRLISEPHPSLEIFPCHADMGFWRVIFEGPSGTPYENGVWLVYVLFPDTYPNESPEVRFVTPIRHCNVNQYGKVCHSVFTRNWTSDTSIHQVLSCVYGLLLTPETDDPLDTDLALLYFIQRDNYNTTISQHVKKHASKTKAQWKLEFEAELSPTQDQSLPCLACEKVHLNGDIEWIINKCRDCDKLKLVSHVWKMNNGQIVQAVSNEEKSYLCPRCWAK